MSTNPLTDLLAEHADALNTQTPANAAASLDARGEVASLMSVAARAHRALRPLQPAPTFHARLRDSLMMAAHHQQAHRLLVLESREAKTLLPAKGNWGWVIGAAALGSAAGFIAVLLRSRVQTKPHAQPQMPH